METRILDRKAFEIAQKLKEAGKTQAQIAEALNAQGYVTRKNLPVRQVAVSKLLLSHGTKRKVRRIVKDDSKRLLKDLREVMDSDLNPRLKEKFIRVVVGHAQEFVV